MNGKLALPFLYLVSISLFLLAYQKPSFGIEFLSVAMSGLAIYETAVWFAVPTRFRVERKLSQSRLQAMDTLKVEVLLEWDRKFNFPLPWLKIEEILPSRLMVRQMTENTIKFPWWQRQARFTYQLSELPRGYYHLQFLDVHVGDALGLVTRTLRLPVVHRLVVYPRALNRRLDDPHRVGNGVQHRERLSHDEGDQVMGARPYRDGDRMQKIHWAATARRGTLVSKEFEPTFAQENFLLLVADQKGFGNDSIAFETALSLVVTYFEKWRQSSHPCQFWLLGAHAHQFVLGKGSKNSRILEFLAMAQPEETDLVRYRDLFASIPAYSQVELIVYEGSSELKTFMEWAQSKKWKVKLWFAGSVSSKVHAQDEVVTRWIRQTGVSVDFFEGN